MIKDQLHRALYLLQSGEAKALLDHCDQTLRNRELGIADIETLLILKASALEDLGHHQLATSVYRSLTEQRPHIGAHWANLARALHHGGEYASSDEAYRRALSLDPGSIECLLDYGLLLMDIGRIGEARHRFLDAVDMQPDLPDARIYASIACFECGDAQRAVNLLPDARHWGELSPQLSEYLATALMQVGRIDEAERILKERLGNPPHAPAAVRLAQLFERTNRTDDAARLLNLIEDPRKNLERQLQIELLGLKSSLALRMGRYDDAIEYASALLDLHPSIQIEANAHFTLASIADKQKNPSAAIAHLEKAHAIHFKLAEDIIPEIARSDAEPLKVSSKWLTTNEFVLRHAPSPPNDRASPVFIVGFPRSGTTMLEQMLDAHPGYASMDERATLQRCIEHMEKRGFEYPGDLGLMDAAAVDELRAIYWNEVAKVISLAPGQQLVDKNPLNMLRLPMILRLFPNAKIILALRHPCDVLLSCYMQNFRSPAFMVLCSSLERLAKSYVNAMRFWIHHQALLSPDTLVLRYEDTVGDFPAQVDRIGAFLGIEDRDFLAQFSEHAARKGYISTPSYSQVVEPVNTRAVGRWQPYARWLAPALPILQPVADHWGYDLTVR